MKQEVYAGLWATITRGKVWRGEFINRRKNGEEYNEDAVISPLKDDDGNIEYVNPKIIMVPKHYKLKDRLEKALKSKYTSAMGDNAPNPMYGKWTIVESTMLAEQAGFGKDDHAFVIIDPDYNKNWYGGLWYDRVPLSVKVYEDDPTGAMVTTARARFGADFYNWRFISYVALNDGTVSNATDITTEVRPEV